MTMTNAHKFINNVDFLNKIDHLGYLSQILFEIFQGKFGEWKIRISVSIGDDFTERNWMKFESVKIIEAIVANKEGLDNFFNSILNIPNNNLELFDNDLITRGQSLPSIGESSSSFENFNHVE